MASGTGRLLPLLLCCVALVVFSSAEDDVPQEAIQTAPLTAASFTWSGTKLRVCAAEVLVNTTEETEVGYILVTIPEGSTNQTNVPGAADADLKCALFDQTDPLSTSVTTYDMIVEVTIADTLRVKTATVTFTAEEYNIATISWNCTSSPSATLYRVARSGAANATDTMTGCLIDPTPDTFVCYTQTLPTSICYTPTDSDPAEFKMCVDGTALPESDTVPDEDFTIGSLTYPDGTGSGAKFTASFNYTEATIEAVVFKLGESSDPMNPVEIYQCKYQPLQSAENDCDLPTFVQSYAEYEVCAVALDDAGLKPIAQGTSTFKDLDIFAYEMIDQFVVGFKNGNTEGGSQYTVESDLPTEFAGLTIDCEALTPEDNCFGVFKTDTSSLSRNVTLQFKPDADNTIIYPYTPSFKQ